MMKWVMLAVVIVGMIVPMLVSRRLGAWMENTARRLVSRKKPDSN
jgi:hypothetical protein